MRSDKYILNEEGEPKMVDSLMAWGEWFETSDSRRIVKQEHVGSYFVSTVFLGIDHGFGSPHPVLWETMVFDVDDSVDMMRCGGTREQAEAMHATMIKKLAK